MRECSKSDRPQDGHAEATQCRLVGQSEKRPFVIVRQESPLRVREDEITGPLGMENISGHSGKGNTSSWDLVVFIGPSGLGECQGSRLL